MFDPATVARRLRQAASWGTFDGHVYSRQDIDAATITVPLPTGGQLVLRFIGVQLTDVG